MKKIATILIVLASVLSINAQDSVVFNQGFGVAYYQTSSISLYNNQGDNQTYAHTPSSAFKNSAPMVIREKGQFIDRVKPINGVGTTRGSFSCHYQMRLNYKGFFAISNTHIHMDKSTGFQFAPKFANFKIDLGYQFKKFKLSIGHQCLHAISSYQNRNEYKIAGGYNRIKLTYNIID